MLLISLKSTDPFFNLAVDEFLLKKRSEDFIVLCINDRSVIIGKHQVAHMESDTRFISQHNIPVIRRISGGGTVFHDPGNLNFSFILNSELGKQVDFRKYTLPVIDFLSSLGVDAQFGGKNELLVNGYKISGNAEHVHHGRILHHGTLLYNADLNFLKGSLRVNKENYTSRAVVSNPSLVMNLKEVLGEKLRSIGDLREMMVNWFLENTPGTRLASLTDYEVETIKALADTKYRTWEWNYAYGPEYKFANKFLMEMHKCVCILNVSGGLITECDISGHNSLKILSQNLMGCRHSIRDVKDAADQVNHLPSEFDIFNFF